jgi:hypothetical protein
LKRAIGATGAAAGPLELIVENGSYVKTVRVDYHGGLRYPHLERVAGRPDVLAAIAAARIPQP